MKNQHDDDDGHDAIDYCNDDDDDDYDDDDDDDDDGPYHSWPS